VVTTLFMLWAIKAHMEACKDICNTRTIIIDFAGMLILSFLWALKLTENMDNQYGSVGTVVLAVVLLITLISTSSWLLAFIAVILLKIVKPEKAKDYFPEHFSKPTG